jgi:hypothetical protein
VHGLGLIIIVTYRSMARYNETVEVLMSEKPICDTNRATAIRHRPYIAAI